jgi:hypothetical protein
MRIVWFWIGVAVIAACEAAALQMDYVLWVSDEYTIHSSVKNSRWAAMQHIEKGTVIDNVRNYGRLRPGTIAGMSDGGYFLAKPNGDVRLFEKESEWRTACYNLAGAEPGALMAPSRTEFPFFWKVQVLVMCACLGWLILFRQVWTRFCLTDRGLSDRTYP